MSQKEACNCEQAIELEQVLEWVLSRVPNQRAEVVRKGWKVLRKWEEATERYDKGRS